MKIYTKTVGTALITGALFAGAVFMGGCSVTAIEHYDAPDPLSQSMITQQSAYSVTETIDRLENVVKSKGLTVFARVNHQDNAKNLGLEQGPSTVLIFGSPKIGSPLMNAAPTVAIDLPVKALAYEDDQGDVFLVYNNPEYLRSRHNIEGADVALGKMAGALAKFTAAAIE
jgi:uncharacterized protein (DUF302 family)